MANADSTSNEQEDKKTLILDEKRRLIFLEASWEISGLTKLISQEAERHCEVEILALRGVAMRIEQLNTIILIGLDEPEVSNRHLNIALKGVSSHECN